MFRARTVSPKRLGAILVWMLPVCMAITSTCPLHAQAIVSHPPLRPLPVSSPRPRVFHAALDEPSR